MSTLLVVAVLAAAWSVVAAMLIFEALRRRGERVHFLLLRLLLPWYVGRYRELTVAEQGHPGPLFYHFVVPINVALLAVLAALAL